MVVDYLIGERRMSFQSMLSQELLSRIDIYGIRDLVSENEVKNV